MWNSRNNNNFCNFTSHTLSHCPKYIAAHSYTRTWRPALKQTVNDSHITLHSQNIIECAGTAPTFETSPLMHQLASSFDWNTDSGATWHMTPHRHWIRNYRPLRLPICLVNDLIVYSAGVGSIVFNLMIRGEMMHPVEFTRVLHVPDLKSNLYPLLNSPQTVHNPHQFRRNQVPTQQHAAIHHSDQWEQRCIPRRLYRG